MWLSQRCHKWQYYNAHTRWILDKQGYTRARKYIILITFPQQQWCRKRSSVLRCMYIACFVDTNISCCVLFRISGTLRSLKTLIYANVRDSLCCRELQALLTEVQVESLLWEIESVLLPILLPWFSDTGIVKSLSSVYNAGSHLRKFEC